MVIILLILITVTLSLDIVWILLEKIDVGHYWSLLT